MKILLKTQNGLYIHTTHLPSNYFSDTPKDQSIIIIIIYFFLQAQVSKRKKKFNCMVWFGWLCQNLMVWKAVKYLMDQKIKWKFYISSNMGM